jgi:hypothetical protein
LAGKIGGFKLMKPLLTHLLGILALSFFFSVNMPLAAQGEPDSDPFSLKRGLPTTKNTGNEGVLYGKNSAEALVHAIFIDDFCI